MEYNFADLFESVVDAIPDKVALVCGDRRLTYRELDERSNRLAHHLLDAGIGPGDHIAIHLYNGSEYVEAMIAAFKIRAVPINVNYRYVASELHALFHDADVAVLIHERELSPRVVDAIAGLPTLRHVVSVGSGDETPPDGAVDYDEALAAASPDRGFEPRSGDDLHIIYTGGTTGSPKGVMWRHEDLFFAGMGGGNPSGEPVSKPEMVAENAVSGGMVMFPVPPLMHGAAQLGTFIGFWMGNVVVLVRQFDPVEVWNVIEREKVNTVSLVGDAMARPMAEALEAGLEVDTSSLFVISSAGAIFSGTVREQLAAKLPNLMLLDNFGASETGYQGQTTPGSTPEAGLTFQMNPRTTVVGDDMKPLTPGSGVTGRLALRGRIPLGYYKDPVKTAATFTEIDGERWATPGDMATINADGTITVFGRGSVCINSGGEKIFPEEVEAALKSHPEVFDAVVVGVPDERWGERVAAVIAIRNGSQPTLEDLRQHCEPRLARYKIPRLLVTVPVVKRSPAGKPDYSWARQTAVDAGGTSPAAAPGGESPATAGAISPAAAGPDTKQ
jgi:acyl-CoA synthetase (AMP-forming)/AMP-acid ligase II